MKRTLTIILTGAAAVAIAVTTVGPAAAVVSAPACEAKYGTLTKPRLTISFTNLSEVKIKNLWVTVTGLPTGATPIGISPCQAFNHSVRMSSLPRFRTGPRWRFLKVGSGIGSGVVWISYGHPLTGLPTVQPSFDTSTTRFASVEFSFPGEADMTNVDQFSFPVDLKTYSTANGRDHLQQLASRAYAGTTCSIVGDLHTGVQDFNSTYRNILPAGQRAKWSQIVVRDNAGKFVRVVAPKQRTHQPATSGGIANPYAQGWPSMEPYLKSLAGQTITVEGLFSPKAGTTYAAETGWYQYSGTFGADGSVQLTGTIQASTAPGGTGAVAGSSVGVTGKFTHSNGRIDGLVTGIYDQASEYAVAGTDRNTGTAATDAPNDVYNTIYRDFTTAFTYGYWGGNYGSNSSGFWNSWAPPAAPSGGQPAFAAARANANPATGGDQFLAGNLWAQLMFPVSTNYSIPYGEDYGSGGVGRESPLLSLPNGYGEFHIIVGKDGPAGCIDKL